MLAEKLRDERTRGAQVNHLLQCSRILQQEHHIGRATTHRTDQRQHASETKTRLLRIRYRMEQDRHELVDALAALALQYDEGSVLAEIVNQFCCLCRILEAVIAKKLDCGIDGHFLAPQRSPITLFQRESRGLFLI